IGSVGTDTQPVVTDTQPDTWSAEERWNDWARRNVMQVFQDTLLDDIGDAIGMSRVDMRNEFTALIHKLELEVAELRGELKALRSIRGEGEKIIDLPNLLGRRRGDAA